ncbi:MAG: DUF177 domain-containing protein [Parabacteroides sp.]|nr:DUF177 domain-containing protein [Parabacteroides sp.]
MGKFSLYNVELKNLTPGVYEYAYLLDDNFFIDIEGDQVQKGKVEVRLVVRRSSMMFEMDFQIQGVVMVPCDRCLDDVEVPIDTQNRLVVKFGKEYAEESDEVVVVPEEEGVINLAWFLYEFIALAIPMKHVHAPGECNEEMASKLRKHTARDADDDDEYDDEWDDDDQDVPVITDPRWDGLKALLENDNN